MASLTPGKVGVILGAQWGDEGKGKILDYIIDKYNVDVVARCQGGNNAGHTVVANGRKYDFHILPSGIISKKCMNVIGNGVVVNLDSFFSELVHNGVTSEPNWQMRLMISNEAHLVFSIMAMVDGSRESSLAAEHKIGTTNRGIGPTYAAKCFRNGLRVGDLMGDFQEFRDRYQSLAVHYKTMYPDLPLDCEAEIAKFKAFRDKLEELDLVKDTVGFLHQQRKAGKILLIEGANGALLDIDFGTYPYVTSSNATVGGACTGLGVPPTAVSTVIGVVKAYQTRVGAGPFPTECLNDDGTPSEVGNMLQSIGAEVGVTTGRRRRCGWLDLILLRRSTQINGFTAFALTKLDILDTFPEIKVAVGYKLDGRSIDCPPAQASAWKRIEVEYKTFPGWQTTTAGIRSFDDLPENCQTYIKFIEEFVEVPVAFIGVGADRESLIVR